MSELRKAITDNPYFVTFTTVGWIDIFTRELYCKIITDSFEYCRQKKELKVYAYVIMPSHIHAIIQAPSLSDVIRDLKAHTARTIISEVENSNVESRKDWLLHMFKYFAKYVPQNETYQFWQKTNHPVELYNQSIFGQKMKYIHDNPVEAGLVSDAMYWRYSSACVDSYFKVDEA
jgi:REP element-mobilizing transposase RayT